MAAGTLIFKSDVNSRVQAQETRYTPAGDALRRLLQNRAAVVSLVVIALLVIAALCADTALVSLFTGAEPQPWLAPYRYDAVDFAHAYAPALTRTPEGRFYLLGTDYLGRDTLSRTLYGTRISLAVAVVATTITLIVGLVYGLIAGYGSPALDNALMRFVDFLYGFPALIFIILMQVYLKALARTQTTNALASALIGLDQALGGVFFIFVALGLIDWLGMARLARGQTLACKGKEYVEGARAVGCSDGRIIFGHLLPNILGVCIVAQTLAIPGYILTESFLSFIGLGVEPPMPSWGIMIAETYQGLRTAPLALFVPSAALTITTLAFNFLGDGLRDAFDPRRGRN